MAGAQPHVGKQVRRAEPHGHGLARAGSQAEWAAGDHGEGAPDAAAAPVKVPQPVFWAVNAISVVMLTITEPKVSDKGVTERAGST
jgi:hypothetical protein